MGESHNRKREKGRRYREKNKREGERGLWRCCLRLEPDVLVSECYG